MKRYLKNLIAVLCDRNPFQEELDEKNSQLDKAAANVSALQDQLYAVLNKWDGCKLELVDAKRELENTKRALSEAECTTSCKQLRSMQRLVENLRERIKDKDVAIEKQGRDFRDRMEQMKKDYQQRIDEYNKKIDELKR